MTNRLYQWGRQGLFCTVCCCAMAFDAPQVGFQVLGSSPTGAMRGDFTSSTGYGAGVFADWEVGAGKAFRLAYDGVWYPGSGRADTIPGLQAGGYAETERRCRSHAVTAQYLFYPSGDREGFYVKAGLGARNDLTRSDVTLKVAGAQGVGLDVVEDSGTRLNVLAGLGYDFNKTWGVLAQYSFITVDNRQLGAVQAGISCRF